MIVIRTEKETDISAIYAVETDAFGRTSEAEVVNKARDKGYVVVSLVAVEGDQIVGHALYSRVALVNEHEGETAVALGPIGVLSTHQKQGIGGQLIAEGNRLCKIAGFDFVFVLGHPTYYPKFGFNPTAPFGIRSQYDVPDEVFMVCELTPGSLANKKGMIYYNHAFATND